MSEGLRVVFLPDIHFGPAKDNENITLALNNLVYPYILENNPDLIVVGGDDTDERISLDQAAARYYFNFVMTLSSLRNSKTGQIIPVRYINGTESHQRHQLQAFQWLLTNPDVNVKIFETVSEEIFNGFKILYIPEESISVPKDEYYKSTLFSGKEYDLAFGHGMFDHISGGWGEREEKGIRGSPLWNIDDFNNVYGGAFFGHIHIASNYKNRIYYGGSLTRFCQGEIADKGFLNIYYYNGNSKVDFIKNPYAPLYLTIQFSDADYCAPVEDTIRKIIEYQQKTNCFELRCLVNREKIDAAKYRLLHDYFVSNRHMRIRVEYQKDRRRERIAQENIGKSTIMSSRNPEIVDALDWEQNTVKYAKENYNVDIDRDKMIAILAKAKNFDQL